MPRKKSEGSKKSQGVAKMPTPAERKKLRAAERAQEPLVNKPTNFSGSGVTYPAVYGVDMKSRQREAILRDITRGGS